MLNHFHSAAVKGVESFKGTGQNQHQYDICFLLCLNGLT